MKRNHLTVQYFKDTKQVFNLIDLTIDSIESNLDRALLTSSLVMNFNSMLLIVKLEIQFNVVD